MSESGMPSNSGSSHVVDEIDGHARHANISTHARVIAVIAPVSRQVEGDGKALLPRGEVAPVKCV